MAFLDGDGVTNLVTCLKTKFAGLVNNAVQIGQGGTGATDATTARKNLGDLVLASSIAPVESSTTASNSHTKDTLFMLDGKLRKVLSSGISVNDEITNQNSGLVTIQDLINNFNPETFTPTKYTSSNVTNGSAENVTLNNVNCFVAGRIVFVNVLFYLPTKITVNGSQVTTPTIVAGNAGVTNQTVLATVPNGVRPITNAKVVGGLWHSGAFHQTEISITAASGSIMFYTTTGMAPGDYLYVNMIYNI